MKPSIEGVWATRGVCAYIYNYYQLFTYNTIFNIIHKIHHNSLICMYMHTHTITHIDVSLTIYIYIHNRWIFTCHMHLYLHIEVSNFMAYYKPNETINHQAAEPSGGRWHPLPVPCWEIGTMVCRSRYGVSINGSAPKMEGLQMFIIEHLNRWNRWNRCFGG